MNGAREAADEARVPEGDATVMAALAAAAAAERREIVEQAIAAHPDGRLRLTGDPTSGAALAGAALSGLRLRRAGLAFADLRGAELVDAHLASADLRSAQLEHADARGSDLTGADLSDARLGEAKLAGSLLEETDLTRASLRFADLREAVLEGARMDGADLWGAVLEGADLSDVSMRGARVGEAFARGADLTRADLRDTLWTNTDLRDATLIDADLRGAVLKGANLAGASLAGAQLQEANLLTCHLAGVHWADARLTKTRMVVGQLGDGVGEHQGTRHAAAARAYLALERNFIDLGDPAAASWAYRRRRRMEKQATRDRAIEAAKAGHAALSALEWARFAGDQLVEWVCDYGESLPRVAATLLTVFVVFAILYGVTGSVLRQEAGPHGQVQVVTHDPVDLAIFSLGAMTTSGLPTVTLTPVNVYVNLLSGVQALFGIFLTGLLGFVAGARIRR